MPPRAEVNALDEEQLRPVLRSLGVLSQFETGELRCMGCNAPLVEAGVAAVRMEHGRLIFACAKLQCSDVFYE